MINASEIATAREQQPLNDKNFHVSIYNKTESINGLYQYDYYGFTSVLAGCYLQETNGKHVLLERGDFVFIPLGSYHQGFYEFGVTCTLNVGTSKRFFEQRYLPLSPYCSVALQMYWTNNALLTYVETIISSLNFRETGLGEFAEVVTLCVISRLRHHREEQVTDDIPQWLKSTVEKMYDKEQLSESTLENIVALSAKSQEYLARTT